MRLAHGVTRSVLLIGKYAIKTPSIRNGWVHFLHGILSNIEEYNFTVLADHWHLCPVLWKSWGGFAVIMPRCEELTPDEYWEMTINAIKDEDPDYPHQWYGINKIDWKINNFGKLNGRIVLLDYGELT